MYIAASLLCICRLGMDGGLRGAVSKAGEKRTVIKKKQGFFSFSAKNTCLHSSTSRQQKYKQQSMQG